jgi:RNA-binding protein YhbY
VKRTKVMKFQIGKNGIVEGTVETLASALKTHRQVRISVLKASGRNKENIKEMAEQLKEKLIKKTELRIDYKIIGFTIIILNL